MLKVKVVWLLTFLFLSFIVVPVIIYDETRPSSLCTTYGIPNPFTGGCFGSFVSLPISFEHEAIGLGMMVAALALLLPRSQNKNYPIVYSILLIGTVLFVSDSFFPLNPWPAFTDYYANVPGSAVSFGVGAMYGLTIGEIFKAEDLGSVTIPV